MNLAEALLAAYAGKLTQKATEDFEVKRLSNAIGEPFILHLRQISTRRITEIQANATSYDPRTGKVTEKDSYGMIIVLLCDGITNKDFDNWDVLKHYGAATRKDLLETLFNVGEITAISERISKLCGMTGEDDKVEEVKN